MLKVAVLFTNYGPYHVARLEAFNKVCAHENWTLNCIELAREEVLYPWKIIPENTTLDFTTLITHVPLESVSIFSIISRLFKELRSTNPDIVAVAGYANPAIFFTLLWGIVNRKKIILLSATKEDDACRNPLTESLKRLVISRYSGALVGGKPQQRYLAKLGMPPDHIKVGYNVVGNQAFNPTLIRKLPSPLEKPYFLSVNRFVPKKNLLLLLQAYNKYQSFSCNIPYDLVLCGDGPLKSEVESYISRHGLKHKVHLPGFLQQDELKPYYAHAKCFIHASLQEQWGLVVNEAMAAGLPVLVSNKCGCYEDLILEGVNGFSFTPDNVSQLSKLMLKVSSEEINLLDMGEASLAHIKRFSPEYFAKGLRDVVQLSLDINS